MKTLQFWDQFCPILGQDLQILNIIFKINELDLLWVTKFIALETYFIFGTKSSWNGGIDTCFNVECVLFGRNFYFLGGYLVVTALYLVVTARYFSFPLLVWTVLRTSYYLSHLFHLSYLNNLFGFSQKIYTEIKLLAATDSLSLCSIFKELVSSAIPLSVSIN